MGRRYAPQGRSKQKLSYETGIEWFNRGVLLEEIPENYKNNEYFMDGYNSCNKKSR